MLYVLSITECLLANSPALVFEETQYDFSYQPPNRSTVLEHDFFFRNHGDHPVRLLSLGRACRTLSSCGKTEWLPDEKGVIRVTVNLPSDYTHGGPFSREVLIVNDDRNHPKIELKVTANFGYTLACAPLEVHFGMLKKGQTSAEQTVELESRTSETFRVTGFRALKGLCEVALTSQTLASADGPSSASAVSPPLRKACWTARVKTGSAAPGPFCDILQITTDRADIPRIEIPVDGEVEGQVAVEPSEIFLGIVRGAAAVEKEVLVRANGSGAKLKAVHSDIEGLSAKAEPMAEGWRVKLRMEPTGREEPVEGKLTIDMDGAEGGELTVPVRGLLKPQMKAARR